MNAVHFFFCAKKIPESTFASAVSEAQTPTKLHVFRSPVPREPATKRRLSDTVRKAEPSTLKPQELLRDVLGYL